MESGRGPLLIFDGDCAFCTSAANWAAAGWRRDATIGAWQLLGADRLAEFGLTLDDARSAAWWVDGQGGVTRGHRAVARALQFGHGWRRAVGVIVDLPVIRWVGAGVYPVVVRYRHRLPGATPACRVG